MTLNWRRAENHPNVLLVWGDEIGAALTAGTDPRQALIAYLESGPAGCPVGRGTHDVWITYQSTDAGANWSWQDMSVTPRPRRGVVQMGQFPAAAQQAVLVDQLATMVQEVGHSWCVPSDLRLRHADFWPGPSDAYLMPSGGEIATSQADGTPFTGPLLLGRTDSHWCSFFDSDGSGFDGMNWVETPDDGGFVAWTFTPPPDYTVAPAGLAPLALATNFCDLDLYIMGVIRGDEAYRSSGGTFRWMEPRYTAPLAYHAGLVLGFSDQDFYYFGFRGDHRRIGLEQTGVNGSLRTWDVPEYRPLGADANHIALRIIRRGHDYYFQARLDTWEPSLTPRLLDALETAPPTTSTGSFAAWRTLSQITRPESPQAVGGAVKTWDRVNPLCAVAFYNFEIQEGAISRSLLTGETLPRWDRGVDGYRTLPDRLVVELPQNGQIAVAGGGACELVAPFAGYDLAGAWNVYPAADHWAGVNNAPKALVRAPSGDFAVATSARVTRSGLAPWAAGALVGRTMWGRTKIGRVADVILSDQIRARQAPPPANAYKMAFVIAARQQSDMPEAAVAAVDQLRQYWTTLFATICMNRRTADTSL